MTKNELRVKLARILRDHKKLLCSIRDAKREPTAEETRRLNELERQGDAVEDELLALVERGGEMPVETGNDDPYGETRGVPTIEDRSVYDAWPREEADQFMRCVVGMTTSRQLPSGIHRDLAETFLQGPQYRDLPTGQGTVELDTGGFLIPATLADSVLRKTFSEGQILSRCREVPITVGRTASWPAVTEVSRKAGAYQRFGGIQVYRVAEAAAATQSKLNVHLVNLELKKQVALLYATDEILEDAAQMATLILELTPQAFTFAIEEEIIRANGAGQCAGILNANCKIAAEAEDGQNADTIVAENILEMERRMAPGSMGNAIFLTNQNALPQLRKLFIAVGTAGVQLYMPPTGLAAAPFGTLLGRPLVVSEHCSVLGDEGDLIFADFSQYLYARKGALKTAQSIHVKFVEGEQAFRFTMRNAGQPWWATPLAPAQGDDDADSVSPFITLAARS